MYDFQAAALPPSQLTFPHLSSKLWDRFCEMSRIVMRGYNPTGVPWRNTPNPFWGSTCWTLLIRQGNPNKDVSSSLTSEVRGMEDGHVRDSVCFKVKVFKLVWSAFAPTGIWLDTPSGQWVMVSLPGRWPCFPECNGRCPPCCNTATISLLLFWFVWGSVGGHNLNWRSKGEQLLS